ncbi:GTP cyclohydrolase I, partial [Vibrio cidicii]|uniref:GTP cyclohydrolase I n=1 Tax=Vibrio cidicii TaxID=1763883 RepID=UPI003703E45F
HHLLPFAGVVHIAYQPLGTLLGLSDLPRLVRRASSRLRLQEDLTRDIATQLRAETSAQGVIVVMEARHGCVSDRGIRQARARATTVASLGTFDSPSGQAAMLALLLTGTG